MSIASYTDTESPAARLRDQWRRVTRADSWRFTDPKTRALFAILVASFILVGFAFYIPVARSLWHGTPYTNDFFAFWAWSKLIRHATGLATIYNPTIVKAFEHSLDHSFTKSYPFPYPPSYLLIVWPLALMSRATAYLLWLATTFVAYAVASWDRRFGREILILALFAPISVIVVASGQNGFLTSALLIGGCRLVNQRPILAGILFGLLSFKPHLGLLIPVALIAGGLWRPILAAAVTIALTAIASVLAFGWPIWGGWLHAMLLHSQEVASTPRLDHLMMTVAGSMRLIGAGPRLANLIQLFATTASAALVWRHFRGGFDRMPIALLLVATFLATPYAFSYDLPAVSTAVLLVVLDRYEVGDGFKIAELLVLAAALWCPFAMLLLPTHVPVGLLIIAALLLVIVRRSSRGLAAPATIPIGAVHVR